MESNLMSIGVVHVFQLHTVIAIAEENARVSGGGGIVESESRPLSRASSLASRRSFVWPDTVEQRVNVHNCPVCQLLQPRSDDGHCVSRARLSGEREVDNA